MFYRLVILLSPHSLQSVVNGKTTPVSQRKLPGYLSYTESLSGNTTDQVLPDILVPGPWSDNTTRQTISLSLTAPEFIQLATSIDVGRDIAYPDDSVYVWALWTQRLVREGILDCDTLVSCIETNSAVQDAILNLVGQYKPDWINGTIADNPNGTGTTPLNVDCDYNALWGRISAFVDYVDQTNRDGLEILESYGTGSETIGAIIEAIPLIGEAPADDFYQLAAKLAEFTLSAYNSASTPALLLDIKAKLFCEFRDQCSFTMSDALNVFADLLGTTIYSNDTSVEFIARFVAGQYINEQLVYALSATQLYFVGFADSWLAVPVSTVYEFILGAADSDDDWQLIIDQCPSAYSHRYLFTTSKQGWYSEDDGFGNKTSIWSINNGWRYNDQWLVKARRAIAIQATSAGTITQVNATLSTSYDEAYPTAFAVYKNGVQQAVVFDVYGLDLSLACDVSLVPGDEFMVYEVANRDAFDNPPVPGFLRTITVSGTGVNPLPT